MSPSISSSLQHGHITWYQEKFRVQFNTTSRSVGGDGLGGCVEASAGVGPVRGDVLDHVGLLPEGPGADLADEGLLAGVDLEVLLEV